MKVLFPTASCFPAQNGGPDNTVYWLTKALTKQGVEIKIVTSERGLPEGEPRNQWLDRDFAQVIYTKNLIHYFPLALIFAAWKELKSTDVLHLTMIFYPACFLLAFINFLFYQKPVVWSIRGDLDPHMMRRSAWKKRPVAFFIRRILRNQVVFHSTCDEETRYVKDVFGQDIQVVQLTNYMVLPEMIEKKKEKSLLYLGRIDSKKAIENLIAALDLSKHFRSSDFRMKIAGDHHNAYGQGLVTQVQELGLEQKVEFVGHVAGNQKQELLAEAYFLIMPSHTENFGIVVTEALAQNTPAVASIYTPWKVLEEQNAGFWVDNDSQTLADCIDRILLLTEEEYDTMQGNTPALVRQFDIYANVGKWEKVYEGLTKTQISKDLSIQNI